MVLQTAVQAFKCLKQAQQPSLAVLLASYRW